MDFPYQRSLNILEEALSNQEFSGFALYCRVDTQEYKIYQGNHACKDFPSLAKIPVSEESIFDLASLTKVLSTVPIIATAIAERRSHIEESIHTLLPEFPYADITIANLLNHHSGLPAHIEFFKRLEEGHGIGKEQLLSWLSETPVHDLNEAVTEYSDLGFMLLGLIVEIIFGKTLLEVYREKISLPLGLKNSGFRLLANNQAATHAFTLNSPNEQFVATEDCPDRKKLLLGEVHDDNCWYMGGYAGHAGLFANLDDCVTLFENSLSIAKANQELFFPDPDYKEPFKNGFMVYPGIGQSVGSEWHNSIGHTGFTGTSLWYDPESENSVVLLTNRVHPSRGDKRFVKTRREFHNMIWREIIHIRKKNNEKN